MLRNTAGQTVGAQLLTAADGTAFTGAVTAYVTGDGGTQAVGSVGAGACVHEGNGYHSYAPAQAETNYAHVAFTFIGTGAAPATVQVYTKAGDAFTRLGAPVGASISADLAAVQSDTNDIQTRLPAALVSGRMDSSVGAMAANVLTAAATAADYVTEVQASAAAAITAASLATAANVAAVEADTQDIQARLPAALVSGRIDASVGAMAANVIAAAATASDFVTEVQNAAAAALTAYDPPTNAEMVARTLPTADYATAAAVDALPTAAENADAVWDEAISGHATSGTTGAALIAAGSAGDPWSTTLPGAYGAGTAGNIIGNALDTTISSRAAAAALATAQGDITSILADTSTDGVVVATASKTGYALSAAGVDAILDDAVETGATVRESLRLSNSVLGGKASGLGTTEVTFRDLADTKDRVVATVDGVDGNRTAVTRDLA